MTETEWIVCDIPDKAMLFHLRMLKRHRTNNGRRKLRLFACSCSQMVAHLLTARGRRDLRAGEDLADGLLDKDAAKLLILQTFRTRTRPADVSAWFTLPYNALSGCRNAASAAIRALELEAEQKGRSFDSSQSLRRQADFLRDIFGNPFRPVAIDPLWLTWNDRTVLK